MIDRLRAQIQERLHQVTGEADRLRRALSALDPRPSSSRQPSAATEPGRSRGRPSRASRDSSTGAAAGRRARTASSQPGVASPAGASRQRSPAGTPDPKPARQRRTQPTDTTPAGGGSARAGRGATRTAVLAALGAGEPLTAGQVAEKTGLGRPTVSTTLSRLVTTGDVEKADRGYRLATSRATTTREKPPAKRPRKTPTRKPAGAATGTAATSGGVQADAPEEKPTSTAPSGQAVKAPGATEAIGPSEPSPGASEPA